MKYLLISLLLLTAFLIMEVSTPDTYAMDMGTISAQGAATISSDLTLSGSTSNFYAGGTINSDDDYARSFVINSPLASADYPLWRVPYAITITGIHVLTEGGTNCVGGLDEADANGDNASAVDSDITGTAGTNVSDDGSLSNPDIDTNDYILWHTTSVSGAPISVTVSFEYTIDY